MLARLKELRKSLGLNQTDFARALGITQTAYSMLENGINPLQDRHIKVLCSVYRVSETWLRQGEGEMLESSEEEKELRALLSDLAPPTMQHLLDTARRLLAAEANLHGQATQQDGT